MKRRTPWVAIAIGALVIVAVAAGLFLARRGRGGESGAALPAALEPATGGAAGDARGQGGAAIEPASAGLGERLAYTGVVTSAARVRVRFVPPRDDGAFHWGKPATRVLRPGDARPREATVARDGWLEIEPGVKAVVSVPLQVFAYGPVAVPGVDPETESAGARSRSRLPVANVTIVPVIAANDSTADFHALRGPLAAPWWERVPWWIVGGAVALVAAALGFWRWRRRRRAVAPASAPVARAPRRDPTAEALAELAALRRLGLPAQGRFAEHAWRLTRVLRRFFEDTIGAPRPGDTSSELVQRLGASLDAEDVKQVDGLLRVWDRVKFARAASSAEEAERAEQAVEALVRRRSAPAGPERAA